MRSCQRTRSERHLLLVTPFLEEHEKLTVLARDSGWKVHSVFDPSELEAAAKCEVDLLVTAYAFPGHRLWTEVLRQVERFSGAPRIAVISRSGDPVVAGEVAERGGSILPASLQAEAVRPVLAGAPGRPGSSAPGFATHAPRRRR